MNQARNCCAEDCSQTNDSRNGYFNSLICLPVKRLVTLDLLLIAAKSKLEGILKNDGQQLGRWLTAEDRPLEASGQQVGNTSHVIDMHMGGNQGLDASKGKINRQLLSVGSAIRRGLGTLKQTTINQQAVLGVHLQLVTRACHANNGAVMQDLWVVHG